MPQHLLEIAGHRLAAWSENEHLSGTPVVFIPGITVSIDFWRHTLPPEVRDGRRWISLSLPGHYPSQLPKGFSARDVTIDLFTTLHLGAIRQLVGERQVALVGWSTGGFSSLNLASRHPERVSSVLSLCGFSKGFRWGIIGRMRRLLSLGKIGRIIFRSIWTALGRHESLFALSIRSGAANRRAFRDSPLTPPTLAGWREDLRHQDLDGLASLFESLADLDLGPQLPAIKAPTMIVGGERDPYIPASHTKALAAAVPGAELRILPDTGHMFFAESTAEYYALLIDWLARTTEAPGPSAAARPIAAAV